MKKFGHALEKGSQGAAWPRRRDILRLWKPATRVFVEHAGTDGGWAWK